MSVSLPPISIFESFAGSLLEGLYDAGCKRQNFRVITDATIGNTILFMRLRRLEGLAGDLSTEELWLWEMRCEEALLKTVEGATMPPERTRKGRGKDPDVGKRFVRTLMLREQGKTFPEIRELLGSEFGRARDPDSYRKLFDRYIKDFRAYVGRNDPALLKDLDTTLERIARRKRTK